MESRIVGLIKVPTKNPSAEAPPGLETDACPKTTRSMYVLFGGMPQPSPSAEREKAAVVRIIISDETATVGKVSIVHAPGASMFADHRASRPGHSRVVNILRLDLKPVCIIFNRQGVTMRAGSSDAVASLINKELAAMGQDRAAGSCEVVF